MFRVALRKTLVAGNAITTPSSQPTSAWIARGFAAAAGKKPKVEDGTLEGRYATALFMASSGKVDKVYGDLAALKEMMAESKEFKLMVETPGIQPEMKSAALEQVCSKIGTDPATLNFLKVLIENKRMHLLAKMIDMFEMFYRAEKGLVLCKVTSAGPLNASAQASVKKAMESRAEQGATLIMEYDTNPAIMGGLVVKMGEAVFDMSVQTKLERLQTQLLAPVE